MWCYTHRAGGRSPPEICISPARSFFSPLSSLFLPSFLLTLMERHAQHAAVSRIGLGAGLAQLLLLLLGLVVCSIAYSCPGIFFKGTTVRCG